MKDQLETLLERMRLLEKEVMRELEKKQVEFFYEVRKGKIRFTEEARTRHKMLVKKFTSYIRDSRFWILVTTPVIWACAIPIAFVDLAMMIYQAVCFPIYGIPKVSRHDHIILDRHHLKYLNWAERLNCLYCGYANGVLSCATEIAARTEQYWCPIKHAMRMKSMHSRYRFFFDYGNAEYYRRQIEFVRRSFEDIDKAKCSDAAKPKRDQTTGSPPSN